jgi:cytosine/adenosine deaminase-related metal-dependent hydrolase
LIRYHAAWLLPISEPPIRDGWVEVDRGRVVSIGRRVPSGAGPRAGPRAGPWIDVDLGRVAIMPGVVNAHTHLELSYLRGGVPPAAAFVGWVRAVLDARRRRTDPRAADILDAVDRAVEEATAAGTALIGDISNTLVTFAPLSRSRLAAVVFYELIRFNAPEPDALVEEACRQVDALVPTERVRASLAAHAPYSVGPSVFRAIRSAIDHRRFGPCSVHVSESPEEVEFIRAGGGSWRALLEEVGAWDPSWTAPGVSPVQFLDDSGFLDSRVLAVHGVQMSAADLARLAARGTTLVTCPRSNIHTGAGAPPVAAFYASGVRVAVGTDSLASAPDLNVFGELAAMRALAPAVPASALLVSATREGARALGFDADFGTIEPGKRARLLAVEIPPGRVDVEEYLVSGIQPAQLRWLDPES